MFKNGVLFIFFKCSKRKPSKGRHGGYGLHIGQPYYKIYRVYVAYIPFFSIHMYMKKFP